MAAAQGLQPSGILDSFAKSFGTNKVLGKTFFESLVAMQFNTASTKFLHLRTALVACNLISPKQKVIDGLARLVTKTDMLTISRKDKLLQAIAGETILTEAWDALLDGLKTDAIKWDERNMIFGRLASRWSYS